MRIKVPYVADRVYRGRAASTRCGTGIIAAFTGQNRTPMPSQALIRLANVTKVFPGPRPRTVLAGISLDVARGELVAILGESGIGKSTLLNLIAGLEHADTGTVEVAGVVLDALDDDALTRFRREKIGFVFQAFHVLPYLSIAQNVALPLALLGQHGSEARQRVDAMLSAVGLAERAASMPRELSGGELQRVAIARALVHRPAVVLADEPTGNLDPDSAAGVIALLRDCVRTEGATGVLATHSRMAASQADRALVLTATGLAEAASP
jgi:putative ABC transport system ATP-binding protein